MHSLPWLKNQDMRSAVVMATLSQAWGSVCTCTETIFEGIKYKNMNLYMISYDFEKRKKTNLELE